MPREQVAAEIDPTAIDGLKFSQCVPPAMAAAVLQGRMSDRPAIDAVLSDRRHIVR